jgi:hypothetical protein
MTDTLYPPSRPQSVSEILDLAFRIFSATLLKCLPLAALAVIAGQLPTLYDLATGQPVLRGASVALAAQRLHDPTWWIVNLVAILGTMTLTNAVLLREYALASGHAAAIGTELATGARRIPGMFLISLLLALAIIACFLPASIFLASASFGAVQVAGIAVVVLVMLIPASWLLIRWSCAITVYLVSDRGPVASMTHSWRLTVGNFWRLGLIYSVALALVIVLYVLSGVISGVVSLLFARGDVAVITAAAAVVVVLLGAVATPFYWALALAVLGDLSVRKEGTDLAQRIAAPATQ